MFALIGAGNHGSDILVIAKRRGLTISVYDDDPDVAEQPPADFSGYVIYGVNDPLLRREMAARFPDATPSPPLVDLTAVVGPDCDLGAGAVIAPQTVLESSVRLGKHCHVNYCVGMTRTNVGDYSTISPGATICGNVEIGEATSVGAGSVICERTQIGRECVIGAGSVIPPYSIVPDGTTVIGVWKNA